MIYTLMNKNTELFDIEMSNGNIHKVENFRTDNFYLLPVFLITARDIKENIINIDRVIEWWQSRRIPASRDGIKELFFNLNNITLDYLSEKSLGLSLSDQYWLRPDMSGIKWEAVNFFQNDFSEDIGNLLITGDWNGGNLVSPDSTSDGAVRKRWKIVGGERFLIKGSSSQFYQTEPFREVFASKIADLFFNGDFIVNYALMWEEGKTGRKVYSACKNFITADTEYVPFTHFREINGKIYAPEHYDICAKIYGEYKYILDLTLILDYIVLNEDRHFGNFGMIRNSNTGAFIKPAPVFDTGSSLFHNSVVIDSEIIRAKPFSKNFEEQIKLVRISDYRENITAVKENAEQIFWEVFADAFEDKCRLSAILSVVQAQADKLLR